MSDTPSKGQGQQRCDHVLSASWVHQAQSKSPNVTDQTVFFRHSQLGDSAKATSCPPQQAPGFPSCAPPPLRRPGSPHQTPRTPALPRPRTPLSQPCAPTPGAEEAGARGEGGADGAGLPRQRRRLAPPTAGLPIKGKAWAAPAGVLRPAAWVAGFSF